MCRRPARQLGGLGERCKLSQRGLGQIRSGNRILCFLASLLSENQFTAVCQGCGQICGLATIWEGAVPPPLAPARNRHCTTFSRSWCSSSLTGGVTRYCCVAPTSRRSSCCGINIGRASNRLHGLVSHDRWRRYGCTCDLSLHSVTAIITGRQTGKFGIYSWLRGGPSAVTASHI